jgi:hypothetical protein
MRPERSPSSDAGRPGRADVGRIFMDRTTIAGSGTSVFSRDVAGNAIGTMPTTLPPVILRCREAGGDRDLDRGSWTAGDRRVDRRDHQLHVIGVRASTPRANLEMRPQAGEYRLGGDGRRLRPSWWPEPGTAGPAARERWRPRREQEPPPRSRTVTMAVPSRRSLACRVWSIGDR